MNWLQVHPNLSYIELLDPPDGVLSAVVLDVVHVVAGVLRHPCQIDAALVLLVTWQVVTLYTALSGLTVVQMVQNRGVPWNI